MTVSVADLVVQETVSSLYSTWLSIADTLGLSTSTWRDGDPTKSLAYYIASLFQQYESTVSGFVSGGFLELAQGDWAYIKAEQDYGTTQRTATFASCNGNLINSGAGVFDFDPGDIVVGSATTGKTYRNTDTLHLSANATIPITVIADEAGSASNAIVSDLTVMVSSFAGVSFTNTTAAVADDDETVDEIKARALLSVAAVSPNGPADAYAYIALSPKLNGGTTTVAKVRTVPDSNTGHMVMFLADAAGPTSGGDVTRVQNACAKLVTPLCITPVISAATVQTIAVSYGVWIYDRSGLQTDDVEALIATALEALFEAVPIGGDLIPPATVGDLWLSELQWAIRNAHPDIFRVQVLSPIADTPATGIGYTFALGPITPSVTFVVSP